MAKVITDSNGNAYKTGNGKVLLIDASVDSNIQPCNIKKDVDILGVVGNYDPTPTLQSKTVTPTTSQQTVSPDSGYAGLSSVTVGAVTSAIDNNIQPGAIKKDVTILGVTGTYEGDAMATQVNLGIEVISNTSLSATGLSLVVEKTGTYTISWSAFRSYSSGSFSTRIYVDGSAKGTEHTTWTNSYGQQATETGIVLRAGQTVEVYAKSSSYSRYTGVMNLILQQTAQP